MDKIPAVSEMMAGDIAAAAPDRRRVRTRATIVHSFSSLMFERRYDSFGVADIVAHANVGRSTFYEHFASKDVLLREAMRPMLGVLADAAARAGNISHLATVIGHFWQNRRMGRIVFNLPMRPLIERQLAEMIESRLGPAHQLASRQIAAAQITALEAWTSGAVSADLDDIVQGIARTARLATADQSQ